jgi:DNA processing protein
VPSDEPTTLLSILLSHGASRRLIRRVVCDTWRERGTLVDAAARLKADFGVDPPTARCVADERRVLDRLGVVVVRGDSAEFSTLLASAPDPPIALFVKGRASALTQPLSVAVVGSRRASPPGRGFARTLAADLGRAGAVIVSGLAVGIDGSAHRGALDVGSLTVAVIGGGHARIYASSHRDLASEIAMAGGAVVPEYPPSAAPRRANFPERNRIISGLCAGVVVV